MPTFEPLPENNSVRDVIKAAFDADLHVSGGWGYDEARPLFIRTLPHGHSVAQTEHMLASMRTYLEMHLTRPKEERYGSINLNEISRETYTKENRRFHRVTYRIEAMKERDYERFIEAYKEGYGKPEFNLEEHFHKRKQATLQREVSVYFDVTEVGKKE